MRRVAEFMTRTVSTLRESDTVETARRVMEAGQIRHLPIVDGDGRLAGIVSDRDLARAEGAGQPVRELMTVEVETVAPDTHLTEAALLLIRDRIGSLPVCDRDGKVVGIVTESDFVRLSYQLLGGADLDERLLEEHESEKL